MRSPRAAIALTATLALLVTACSGGDDDTAPTTTESGPSDLDDRPTTTGGTDDADRADIERTTVQPLSCASLWDFDIQDVALGVAELPFSERSAFTISSGETCTITWVEDESRQATLEPGLPSDLEPTARLLDVAGESIAGVGDAAAWFAGSDMGTLAVQESTDLGLLNFRITLVRPDIDDAARRATAVEVAGLVLPNFPGSDAEPAPPPVVELPVIEPPDRSDDDLVRHLLAGEEEGEWDLGERLVEVLTAMVTTRPIIGASRIEGFARDGTGVIALAREYVERGDDAETAAEITALLGRVVPSREQLLASAPTTTTTTTTSTTTTTVAPAAAPSTVVDTTTGSVNGFRRATSQQEPPCEFPVDGLCWSILQLNELDQAYGDGKYLVFVYTGEEADDFGEWPNEAVGQIIDAFIASAQRFEALGKMPSTALSFGGDGAIHTYADAGPELCEVGVRLSLLELDPPQRQQAVAGQMAHCFLAATYEDIIGETYDPHTWWTGGMAIWLSTLVYPNADLEWAYLPQVLAGHELSTTPFERSVTNGMWFQHLQWAYGETDVLELVKGLTPNAAEHPEIVAGWPEMADVFHDYGRSLSDLGVPDSGATSFAGIYDPDAQELTVDEPIQILETVDRFQVIRIEMTVAGGQVACMEGNLTGDAVLAWREGPRKSAGLWSETLPTTLEGTATFLATSVGEEGTFDLVVNDVVDDAEDCDPDSEAAASDAAEDCPLDCGPSQYYSRQRPPTDG